VGSKVNARSARSRSTAKSITRGKWQLLDLSRKRRPTKAGARILNDVTAEKGGGKFVMVHLKDGPQNDAKIKEFKASVRNIPSVDEYDGAGKCILTGETVDRRVVIAKAY
jgi:hypothetical protein